MATVTFHGSPFNTTGSLPATGTKAPDFTLTGKDLADVSLSDFAGKNVILNIFPSIDTPVCAASTRRFNAEAAKFEDTVVLCIAADLPFALGRFCGAEGLERVIPLSAFRSPAFGVDYGVGLTDGPLRGLLTRAIVVINQAGEVCYTQLVGEIGDDPDFEAALSALP